MSEQINQKQANQDLSLLDDVLARLKRLLPVPQTIDWSTAIAAQWRRHAWYAEFVAHTETDDVQLADLLHIDKQKQTLVANTEQFLAGLPANNALLWGARGTGKSTVIHALLNAYYSQGLRLIEVRKDDLADLAEVVETVAEQPYRYIIFCDDLSFEPNDASYKALKSALEGSVMKTAENVLLYATSNRRHLVPEYMSDNQQTSVIDGELHEAEVVEEKISLSDRFGLWLSFYAFKQDVYLEVVQHWVSRWAGVYDVTVDLEDEAMRAEALRWALARGVRNGRSAQYFARHWVGSLGLEQRR